MGIDGVYARTALFEQGGRRPDGLISRHREPDTEVLRFPPVMSRRQLEKSGYLKSFPHLLGCVSCLHGSEAEIRGRRRALRGAARTGRRRSAPADLVLSPAACYPVYPIAASRGPVPAGAFCSTSPAIASATSRRSDLDRLQSFRMREYVCIGTPDADRRFPRALDDARAGHRRRARLAYRVEQASDPFFGRGGKLMAMSQIEQSLKFELLDAAALGRAADRLHELQLSPRPFRHDLGPAQRGRRGRAHRLRRVRHGPARGGAVLDARPRCRAGRGRCATRSACEPVHIRKDMRR